MENIQNIFIDVVKSNKVLYIIRMEKTDKNEKDIAIQKVRKDIDKKINRAIDIAKQCGIIEILMAVIDYHFSRVRSYEKKMPAPTVQNIESFINQDSIKYVIQLIIKFGKCKSFSNNLFTAEYICVAWSRYLNLKSKTNEISAHNESVALLELCPDISFVNENLIRSDMTNMMQEMQILLEYGYRSDYLNNIKKEKMLTSDEYFDLFMEETEPYDDLCRDSLFASPEEIVYTYKSLFEEITERIKKVSRNFEEDKNGLIYPYDMQNMVQLFPCFLFNYCDVLKKFEETTGLFIFNHTIDKKDIDVYNLRFYQLSRKPFINFSGLLILSPELILESMFIDSHYTLLETPYAKEEYKAAASESFLSKITDIAKKFGFQEIKRDYDLFEGKRKIGDLDLILKKDDFYLLIEAKNQNLPLDVYFHDLKKTKEQLEQLKNSWLKHVTERFEYVNKHILGEQFNYIIVSKFPEVISHYSEIPCFSLEEFEKWLDYGNYYMNFTKFYARYYNDEKNAPSLNDMKKVQKRLHPKIWFSDK